WRRMKESARGRELAEGTTRVLLIGAGESAYDLVISMLRDPAKRWRPVAMLDDDPSKRHYRIRGVQVLGTTDQLARVARETEVDPVGIAIPRADSATIAKFNVAGVQAWLQVTVLPAPTEYLAARVCNREIRDNAR